MEHDWLTRLVPGMLRKGVRSAGQPLWLLVRHWTAAPAFNDWL